MRAGSTSRSHSAAGSAKPCSSPSTARKRLAALAALGAQALPVEQEALIVGERRGLDLVAQPLQRVAMDAREQAPLAPLLARASPREVAAHRRALLLERERAPAARRRRASPNGRASASAVTGPSASKRLRTSSRSAVSRLDGARRRARRARSAGDGARQRERRPRAAARRRPRPCRLAAARRPSHGRSARKRSNSGAHARAFGSRHEPEQHERVVQLVGIQHLRPRFARARARSPRGRACRAPPPAPASCSGATARRACAAPRPARRRGTRTASRPRISCASGDGLVSSRQTTSISPASMRSSTSIEPVDVHRGRQAIVERLLARADDPESRDRRRPGSRRRRADPGTPSTAGPRRPCAGTARAASCRCGSAARRAPCSRSSASTTPNIGASSTACVSTSRTVLLEQIAHDVLEREAVHGAERQHDRVLERRGLQLEVERAGRSACASASPTRD